MSTENCKALLKAKFPDTQVKDWKRQAKFLNFDGVEIRKFFHPTVGSVFVNEDRREISENDVEIGYRKLSSLTAQDFYFSITMNSGDDFPAHALVSMVFKPFFDDCGLLDCIHLEAAVEKLLPKDIEMYEEMESVFCIDDEFTFDELQAKFIEAGFCPSEKLDALVRGER